MSLMIPGELAHLIGKGLLSFPVTHFDEQGEFADKPYREHIARMLQHRPAALFAAGGTGEYFSLTLEEYSRVVSAAASEAARRVPVLAGCGYGTRTAIEFARAAADSLPLR